jgi:monoamine oxidase
MPDTVVIGGGAAGIAAARRLHDAGADVLLVEAPDRLGGRAHSDTLALPGGGTATVDLGFGFPPVEQQLLAAARERWETAAHDVLTGPDWPLSDFIDAADPARPMIDAISSFANGATLAEVSLYDWAAYGDAAGDENWALPDGYGHLIRDHARPVPMGLGTTVTRIDHRGPRLRLVTPDGMIEATRAIVCAPTGVIADAALTFDPPPPASGTPPPRCRWGLRIRCSSTSIHRSGPPIRS